MPQQDSCVIIFEGLGPERREIVQGIVKRYSDGWWHHMPNVWLANGRKASFWLSHLEPLIAGTDISLLVLSLPVNPAARAWVFAGPNQGHSADWFARHYTGRPLLEE